MKKYLEYGGKLGIVCSIAMLGVAGAFVMAKDRIEEGKQADFRAAIVEVLGLPPGAESPKCLNPDARRQDQVFFARVGDEERYATQGEHTGYSGPVILAVGAKLLDGDLEIIEARVIQQTETPGLGTRIADKETNLTLWTTIGNALGGDTKEISDWYFLKRFRGKKASNLVVTGDKAEENEKILKITGVTVTSTAATMAVKSALTNIRKQISK
jgi:Na+-translocating ferredoxin:NAD+ oxidoreductase RnfG subunit